jgi:hypothetical protein
VAPVEPLWVSALVALGTAAIVAGVFWGYLEWAGSPAWLLDRFQELLDLLPGVA